MPDYGWAIVGIVGGVLATLGFRVHFDLNEWLRDRHKRRRNKAKNICTHTNIGTDLDGELAIGSWCRSPSGTTQWKCQRCEYVAGGEEEVHGLMQYWATNLEEYEKQERALEKHFKRMGLL